MGLYSRVVSGGFCIVSGNFAYVLSGIAGEGVRGDHRIVGMCNSSSTGEIIVMYSL